MLQLEEIPLRPKAFDGALCLWGVKEDADEAAICMALREFGTISSCELGDRAPVVVRFHEHDSALAAKRAASRLGNFCAGVDTLYNERSYGGRKGMQGLEDDEGRGWCCFEDALGRELVVRLVSNPKMRTALATLPQPKMLALRSGSKPMPIDLEAEQLEGHVQRVVARLGLATFTGKADTEAVPRLYKEYVARIADAIAQTFASVGGADSAGLPQLPPMPDDGEQLPAWHAGIMRKKHEAIVDAVSGKRLDTCKECVQMVATGMDSEGRPLPMRDAESLVKWLADGGAALLTAGPAAGKTWLLSQVVMYALGGDLVPILIEVQRWQKALAENESTFADAPDWVDTFLALTHAPKHHEMLRAARAKKRALLLIDGLDEAGKERARIEAHVAQKIAPQGGALLCTSRPSGLSEEFAAFHRLTLAPLDDVQQVAFLSTRLTPTRAEELAPYLRGTPLDAETKQRVTANPLMLSMIASIAELRTGIDMPTRTADLYSVAGELVLKRGGELPEAEAALLEATFFEAHAAQQRIITEVHLEAAARRVNVSAIELRKRVEQDRLPLLRLLQAEPLEMQAFHLSFQEYYAMRALAARGSHSLPDFRVGDVWWTNAVLMGVQTGDAFGENFAEAAGLAPGDGWRARLVGALAHAALPTAWLPIVAEVAGAPADLPKLKKFVGRYRDVLQREGGKAVTQLVAQQPEASKIFDALREAKTQRVLNWRNKPLAEACVATFVHDEQVNALAVSKTRIVGGAGKAVHVYDAESEERLGKLEGASAVQSVAVFESDDGKGWIAAGFQDGTIKVWDAGQPFHLSPCRLSLPLMPFPTLLRYSGAQGEPRERPQRLRLLRRLLSRWF